MTQPRAHKEAPDYEGDCWCHPMLTYQDRCPRWVHIDDRILLVRKEETRP